ncbi:hypothetical protein MTO96_036694 [Rhipicephalus appendiculatus]
MSKSKVSWCQGSTPFWQKMAGFSAKIDRIFARTPEALYRSCQYHAHDRYHTPNSQPNAVVLQRPEPPTDPTASCQTRLNKQARFKAMIYKTPKATISLA